MKKIKHPDFNHTERLLKVLAKEWAEWPPYVSSVSRFDGHWVYAGPLESSYSPNFPVSVDLPNASDSITKKDWEQARLDSLFENTSEKELLDIFQESLEGAPPEAFELLQFAMEDLSSQGIDVSDAQDILDKNHEWGKYIEDLRDPSGGRVLTPMPDENHMEDPGKESGWDGKSWDVVCQREGKTVLSIRTDGVMDVYDRDGLMTFIVELTKSSPCTPVEIDERAEFERSTAEYWGIDIESVREDRRGSGYSDDLRDLAWIFWQRRAALERKP